MRKIQEDNLPNEDITQLLTALQHLGIVRVGKLRAHWLLYEKPYHVFEESILGLLADLLLALATMARVSGADVVIIEDGRVEFKRAGRTVASFIVASGNGHRDAAARFGVGSVSSSCTFVSSVSRLTKGFGKKASPSGSRNDLAAPDTNSTLMSGRSALICRYAEMPSIHVLAANSASAVNS